MIDHEDHEDQIIPDILSETKDEMAETPDVIKVIEEKKEVEHAFELGANSTEGESASEIEAEISPAPPVELTLKGKVEAIVFAAPEPIKVSEIEEILGDQSITAKDVSEVLQELLKEYRERQGGFRLEYIKRMGYQFQTVKEAGPIMERQFASTPRPISRAAMETLAIIAYRQPATRAEIEFVRGVDSGSIIKALMDRNLVTCVGRRQDLGRPMLFGTTEEFFKVFGIGSIKDLPPVESFQPSIEMLENALKRLEGENTVDIEAFIDEEKYMNDQALPGVKAEELPERIVEGASAQEATVEGPHGESEELTAEALGFVELDAAPSEKNE